MGSPFSRYAIYFIADPVLHERASSWLGWDCIAGNETEPPAPGVLANPAGLDIAAVTATPRKYGFHGTIKPPMRLADGVTETVLRARATELAAAIAPVELPRMQIARLGRFLAIMPTKASQPFAQMAATFVTELDDLRAPQTDAELARRRKAELTPRQDALLQEWGYPYVLEEFRFHMTLSGSLDETTSTAAMAMLDQWLTPVIPAPFVVSRMALAGEGADGRFRVISWLPLGGQLQGS